MPDTEARFAELTARLAMTIVYRITFEPALIDGAEDRDFTIKLGAIERKCTGQGMLREPSVKERYEVLGIETASATPV